mgnify:CR=1 FL=1
MRNKYNGGYRYWDKSKGKYAYQPPAKKYKQDEIIKFSRQEAG